MSIVRLFQFCSILVLVAVNSNAFSAPATTNSDSDLPELIQSVQEYLQDNLDPDILNSLGITNLSKVAVWFHVEAEAKQRIAELEQQKESAQASLRFSEDAMYKARLTLTNVMKQVNMLKLTPAQLAQIEDYNKSYRYDPSLSEWFTENRTVFELVAAFIFALFGFGLGMLWDVWRERKKGRRLDHVAAKSDKARRSKH